MKMTDAQHIRNFLMAGHAVFTLKSLKTQRHYTYHAVKHRKKDVLPLHPELVVLDYRFLNLSTGPRDSQNLGTLVTDSIGDVVYRHSKFQTVMTPESAPVLAVRWFLQQIAKTNAVHPDIEFWHEGRCGACGRALTDPTSIELGIGPTCRGK